MRNLFFATAFFMFFSCKGQQEKETPVKNQAADEVVAYYNKGNYDSIFFMFSPEVKKILPLDKTVEFFTQFRQDAGLVIQHDFKKKEKTASWFRTEFAEGIYWMSISQNEKGEVNDLNFTPYDGPDAALTTPGLRNTTKLSLPFHGEWFVFWGGDTREQNYHVISRAQKNAFDIVMVNEKNRSYKTNGKTNEDYYAFGKPLIAPCDAQVVSVITGVKDNVPGEMNPAQVTGNTIVLKTDAKEYLLFAHLQHNSTTVKTGDLVKKGQILGLCGNSGNSSEPHLHFHIQDKENMTGSSGIKSYFEKILVNGTVKTDYSPVKGERIKNVTN